MKNGQGYVYDFTLDNPYTMFFLKDAYTKDIEIMHSGFPITHHGDFSKDNAFIQDVERKDDSLTVTAVFDTAHNDEDVGNRVAYTVDAGTLLLKEMKTEFIDPGTEQESTQTFELPIIMNASVMPPDGYTAYEDRACTNMITKSTEPDAEGHFPTETTLYFAPIK